MLPAVWRPLVAFRCNCSSLLWSFSFVPLHEEEEEEEEEEMMVSAADRLSTE